jgi:hypothetical protein
MKSKNNQDTIAGLIPLITASPIGKTEMARIRIDAYVDLNTQKHKGSAAFLTAAFFCRPEIVRRISDNGGY